MGRQLRDDEGPEVIAEFAANVPDDIGSNRGERNCELFDLSIEDDQVILNVWNNAGQGHTCPDEWLAGINRQEYLVDGPRWRPIDHTLTVDDALNLLFDETALYDNPVIREIPEGSGFTMLLAATIDMGPARRIANRFDVTLDDSGNVPPDLRQRIFDQLGNDTPYGVKDVNRRFNTLWVYRAGQPVYVISDGECEYAIKYYTSANNPALTSEDVLIELGKLFEQFPDNYSYEVRLFNEDVHSLDLDGLEYVLVDEFENSYDRLWCGESEVAYTVVE